MMRNTLQNLLYNNNYDQPDTSAAAFNTLPIIIQQALLQQQRIVLIANNSSINIASLEALLQPTDMLVLFNDFIHVVRINAVNQKWLVSFPFICKS